MKFTYESNVVDILSEFRNLIIYYDGKEQNIPNSTVLDYIKRLDMYFKPIDLEFDMDVDLKELIPRYKKLINLFGVDLQLTICMEELSEVIKAVSKMIRTEFSTISIQNFVSEYVDLEICISQIKFILSLDCNIVKYNLNQGFKYHLTKKISEMDFIISEQKKKLHYSNQKNKFGVLQNEL